MPPSKLDSTNHEDKKPIKWMEMPIAKFNEIAVPHHVAQLKTLKRNIIKRQRSGDWNGAHKEEVNASLVVKQLKTLVKEMDMLRNNVIDSDVPKFDKMIDSSRRAALNALQEYIDLSKQLPSAPISSDEIKEVPDEDTGGGTEQIMLALEITELAEECRQQEKCAIAWENLQSEVEEVHELYNQLAEIVQIQGEVVTRVEENVETVQENVVEGERQLLQAAKLKYTSYPLFGALIGSCMGGPVGFLAGLKLGGLAAVTCSILGFTGGKLIKEKQNQDSREEVKPVESH